MRVSVTEGCQGHARCAALAPDLFFINDAGYGEVSPPGMFPEERSDDIRTAQMNCPENAVRVRR